MGEIVGDIRRQHEASFKIYVNGALICEYRADFMYQTRCGEWVVEDAKGFRTPEYKLKAKLMRAVFGIAIREV